MNNFIVFYSIDGDLAVIPLAKKETCPCHNHDVYQPVLEMLIRRTRMKKSQNPKRMYREAVYAVSKVN